MIAGNSGGGKSTLADRLSKLLHIPVMHLEQEARDEQWIRRSEEEVSEKVRAFMKNAEWIIEGQYEKYLSEERYAEADRIVFFDMNRFRALWRSLRRHQKVNAGKEKRIGAGTYVFRLQLSYILWLLVGYPKTKRPRILEQLKPWQDKVVVLKNNRDIEKFVEKCAK